MNIDNQMKPYYVCGGFPNGDGWVFFTSVGEVRISDCNEALKILLPLCNGCNSLNLIRNELEKKFKKEEVNKLLTGLLQYQIIIDVNQIFQVFYSYSRNPLPLYVTMSQEETYRYTADQSHLPEIRGMYFKAKFKKTPLQKIMNKRCSTREFSDQSLTREQIYSIVWCAYGRQIKRKNHEGDFLKWTFNVPSGGALYPLFIYLILLKQCEDLKPGIYLWHKEKNILELLSRGNYLAKLENIIDGISSLREATGILCVVADFERSAKKYGNKAYNLIQQEVGHTMQNVALYCAENNIGTVEVGGYYDELLANLLGINFPNLAPLILTVFGKRKE